MLLISLQENSTECMGCSSSVSHYSTPRLYERQKEEELVGVEVLN